MIQDPIIDTSTVDEGPLSSFTKNSESKLARKSHVVRIPKVLAREINWTIQTG